MSPAAISFRSLAGMLVWGGLLIFLTSPAQAGFPTVVRSAVKGQPGPRPDSYWNVDDIRAGMKGTGRTVLKGTKIETFNVEVVGVLKNTSPGRDMVLCKLSGLGLEKTGVIAGMSGSPVYIDGKLLGAVAYGWAYGKEPLCGVTPFSQMHGFVEAFERRDVAQKKAPTRVGRTFRLRTPIEAGERSFDRVLVAQSSAPTGQPEQGDLWLTPLQTPLAATGFSSTALRTLAEQGKDFGLVPMMGGAPSARVVESAKDAPLEPGSPLSVALIRGDFDLSGIGTVTHIEGNRVYGWGHPFMSLGHCEFPLTTGYIHTVCARQSVSFKMGSPIKAIGVINADVSTGIAGWIGPKADMLPLKIVVGMPESERRTFNVEVARQKNLLTTLVFTALANSLDMEGELPEEMTVELKATIEIEGQPPIIIHDVFSGFPGNRAPQSLFAQLTSVVSLLTTNNYKPLRINRIEVETQILAGRRSAEIEAIELHSTTYEPGDTVRATAFVRPYKGNRQRVPVSLKLPADLAEGTYTLYLGEDMGAVRAALRDDPTLSNPQSVPNILRALKVLTGVKRTSLTARVPVGPSGVAQDGKVLADLPSSMVHILGNSRRTGLQTVSTSLVARHPTDWVIQGQESVTFKVTRHKKVTLSHND